MAKTCLLIGCGSFGIGTVVGRQTAVLRISKQLDRLAALNLDRKVARRDEFVGMPFQLIADDGDPGDVVAELTNAHPTGVGPRLPELPTIRSPKPIGIEELGQLPHTSSEVDLRVQGHGRGRRVIALSNLLKKRALGKMRKPRIQPPVRAVN